MPETSVDHNALLLQVMAHDLLAPLTAIKWQLELIGREHLSAKGGEYLVGMQQSTDLGIVLTKRAHVAGRVLVGSFEAAPSTQSLSTVVHDAASALVSQCERHGVKLEIEVDAEERERTFDVELVSVLVWSVLKFFLSCAPAQAQLVARGMVVPADDAKTYVFIVTAEGIPEAGSCVEAFNKELARGTYDHAYVFAHLIRETAKLLNVDVSANTQGTNIIMEIAFRGQTL